MSASPKSVASPKDAFEESFAIGFFLCNFFMTSGTRIKGLLNDLKRIKQLTPP